MARMPASSTSAPATQDTPHSARERLIEVAVDLIWNASYDSVGVNEICTQAQVTKGCFYHHFESKAVLFYAASQSFSDAMRPVLDAAVSPSLSGLEQLLAMARTSCERQAAHSEGDNPVAGCPFHSTAALVGHREPLIARAGQESTELFLRYLQVIIRNLLEQGYAENARPSEQIARLVHQYYQGIMQYGRTYQSRELVERDLADGIALLIGLHPQHVPALRAAFAGNDVD